MTDRQSFDFGPPNTEWRLATTYLVTEATGNIGGRVVDRLLAAGARPRILARDTGKARRRFGDRADVAIGDLAVRDAAAAKAALSAGVRLVVKLSAYDAEQRVGTSAWHADGEADVPASGVGFVLVRPTGFMDNLLAWAASVKSEGVVRSATGDGRIPFIHSDDIADVAVAYMTTPGRRVSLCR